VKPAQSAAVAVRIALTARAANFGNVVSMAAGVRTKIFLRLPVEGATLLKRPPA